MLKKILRKIHLWLGLITGLLVFIIAITGCFYAFQDEIQNATQPYRFIAGKPTNILLPQTIQYIAQQALPNKTLHSIKYYNDEHAVEVTFYQHQPKYHYKMYIHPSTAKVLHIQNMDEGFFSFILKGHMYLWLPEDIGRPIVLVVTIVFAIMVISGLILWWPKQKNVVKNRLWFVWKNTTSFKRKNWDIHSIVGFYSCAFALLFIVTGLVWVMPKFAQTYHSLFGGKKSMVYTEGISSPSHIEAAQPLNTLFLSYKNQRFTNPEIHPPETDSSSILVVTNPSNATYWQSNYVFHNQYNLQQIPVNHIWSSYQQANTADKLLRLNYDLHVGSAWGIWGKSIMCLASLLIASLPITGFMIWKGRGFKRHN